MPKDSRNLPGRERRKKKRKTEMKNNIKVTEMPFPNFKVVFKSFLSATINRP